MKIKAPKAAHYESGPDMTPLVDVVMVILIFLMMVGTIGAASTQYLVTKVPYKQTGGGAQTMPPGWTPPTVLEVFVDPRGDSFICRVGDRQADNRDAVLAILGEKKRQFEAAGNNIAEVQVQVSPRGNAKYRHVIAVFDACNDVGFVKVAFTGSRG
jgi:biopolymer transport protein ExbD